MSSNNVIYNLEILKNRDNIDLACYSWVPKDIKFVFYILHGYKGIVVHCKTKIGEKWRFSKIYNS